MPLTENCSPCTSPSNIFGILLRVVSSMLGPTTSPSRTLCVLALIDTHHAKSVTWTIYPMAQFTSDLRHIKGSENAAADALPRISIGAVSSPTIDFQEMARAQQDDSELRHLQAGNTSLVLRSVQLPASDVTLICDTSTGIPRPFVPATFRRSVFEPCTSHPSVHATLKLIKACYVWPGIKTDMRLRRKTCLQCHLELVLLIRSCRVLLGILNFAAAARTLHWCLAGLHSLQQYASWLHIRPVVPVPFPTYSLGIFTNAVYFFC